MQQSIQDQQTSNFSDDEPVVEEAQILDETESKQEGLSQSCGASIELIYTMFMLYREELNQIAKKYSCKIKFTISTYVVQQAQGQQKQKFHECLREAESFMKSIRMVQIFASAKQAQKRRFMDSPYVYEQLQKKKIRLVYFQKKLFGVSVLYPTEVLKKQLVNFQKSVLVFSICLRRTRREEPYFKQIYDHIASFMKMIFVYYQKFFKERDIDVRLNKTESFIMLHGSKSKYLMECKFTLKNVMESMVCLYVKDTNMDHKYVSKYLAKASLFPVYFAKYSNSTSLLISKDNVLRQLVQKSMNFLKYLGIQKQQKKEQQQQQQNKHQIILHSTTRQPQVGFYLIPSLSIATKLQKIRQKLLQHCYDIQTYGGIRYMKRIYSEKGQQPKNILRQIIGDFIHCVETHKTKFEVIRELRQQAPQPKIVEIDDGLKYQIISGKQQQKELSKILRRDVLCQKVQMKKKYIIAYNVLETAESIAYWCMNKEGQDKQEIKLEQLRKGTYMKGLKKINANGETVMFFQQLLTIL